MLDYRRKMIAYEEGIRNGYLLYGGSYKAVKKRKRIYTRRTFGGYLYSRRIIKD